MAGVWWAGSIMEQRKDRQAVALQELRRPELDTVHGEGAVRAYVGRQDHLETPNE